MRAADVNYIATRSHIKFLPLEPISDDIVIEDIAHSLSYVCRANGHLKQFYSVAQHCINCAREAKARGLSTHVQFMCLLHDASEAYLCDIPRPIKHQLPLYIEAEELLAYMIYDLYLNKPIEQYELDALDAIDDALLYHELLVLHDLEVPVLAADLACEPDYSQRPFTEVEKEFLALFHEYRTLG
ncbi:MAG: phosphohydrolase [Coriobacteriia bacterium]|nr:phosphohydrolase [Coriobacteriia bacterium]